MAIDFIKIDTTQSAATEAATLKAAILQFAAVQQNLTAILNKMGHNNDGTTFTAMETLYGLPTGKGQAIFNLVNGTVGAFNGTFQNNNAKTLIEQVG